MDISTGMSRRALSVAELSLLFRGDDDVPGYPHVNLVVAICEQACPASPHQLMCIMYGVPEEGPASAELVVALDEDDVRTIDAGYRLWSLSERRAA